MSISDQTKYFGSRTVAAIFARNVLWNAKQLTIYRRDLRELNSHPVRTLSKRAVQREIRHAGWLKDPTALKTVALTKTLLERCSSHYTVKKLL